MNTNLTEVEGFEELTQQEKELHTPKGNEPAIYLGTYRKYNSGSIAGQWIDLTSFADYEDFCEFCHRLHADEKDPEFMVQDFENYPKRFYHESGLPTEEEFENIQEAAELDDNEREAYEIYLNWMGCTKSVTQFREAYMGYYRSPEEFAEQYYNDCGMMQEVPEWLENYIDWDGIWTSLYTSGDFFEEDEHIFAGY